LHRCVGFRYALPDKLKQIVVAVGQGSTAAMSAFEDISGMVGEEKKVAEAVKKG